MFTMGMGMGLPLMARAQGGGSSGGGPVAPLWTPAEMGDKLYGWYDASALPLGPFPEDQSQPYVLSKVRDRKLFVWGGNVLPWPPNPAMGSMGKQQSGGWGFYAEDQTGGGFPLEGPFDGLMTRFMIAHHSYAAGQTVEAKMVMSPATLNSNELGKITDETGSFAYLDEGTLYKTSAGQASGSDADIVAVVGSTIDASSQLLEGYINGVKFCEVVRGDKSSNNLNNEVITSNQNDSTIGEVIFIHTDISVDERQRIEGYLAHKWGVAHRLPADHPFKAEPPRIYLPEWTPAELGDAVFAWYDPNEATFNEADYTVVVPDKSGNGYTLSGDGELAGWALGGGKTALTNVNAYSDGMPVVASDGLSSTFFVTYQNNNDNSLGWNLVAAAQLSTNQGYVYASRKHPLGAGPFLEVQTLAGTVNSTNIEPGVADLLSMVGKPSGADQTISMRLNGVEFGSDTTAKAGDANLYIELRAYQSDGPEVVSQMGECIFVSKEISEDDVKRIEGYLAHKWWMAHRLPANHPYKKDRPRIAVVAEKPLWSPSEMGDAVFQWYDPSPMARGNIVGKIPDLARAGMDMETYGYGKVVDWPSDPSKGVFTTTDNGGGHYFMPDTVGLPTNATLDGVTTLFVVVAHDAPEGSTIESNVAMFSNSYLHKVGKISTNRPADSDVSSLLYYSKQMPEGISFPGALEAGYQGVLAMVGHPDGTGKQNVELYETGNLFGSANVKMLSPTSHNITVFASADGTAGEGAMLMGELIYIHREVSADERQKIEGYLAHKWNMASRLPADHPYKADAPRIVVVKPLWSPADLGDAVFAWYDMNEATGTAETYSVLDKSGNGHHPEGAYGMPTPWGSTGPLMGVSGAFIEYYNTSKPVGPTDGMATSFFVAYQKQSNVDNLSAAIQSYGENEGFYFSKSVPYLGSPSPTEGKFTCNSAALTFAVEHGEPDILSSVAQPVGSTEQYVSVRLNSVEVATATMEKMKFELDAPYLRIDTALVDDPSSFDQIGEVIYIGKAISEDDVKRVEGYLAHKWSAAHRLPADHPYKAAPPRQP